jgi:hypothetical protein
MRQQVRLAEAPYDRGQTACVIELLHQEATRWLQIDERRRAAAHAGPVVEFEVHTDTPGNRLQMDRRIGRAADRRVHANRVLKRFAR